MADGLLFLACWFAMAGLAAVFVARIFRLGRRTPAPPDNRPGRNPHLLKECRRIAAQTADSRKEDTP